jgi:hypothetical protein
LSFEKKTLEENCQLTAFLTGKTAVLMQKQPY